MYFSNACRQRHNRRRKAIKVKGGKKSPITPAMKEFRKLVDDSDDFLREVMQEAVRDVVSEAVQDNLLGAAEILTGMLPKVLAGLAKDIESKDWMIRSRAQAAILKYAMEFRDKGDKDDDLGTIQIVHNLALPDTPLGRATAEEILTIEAGEAEDFDADWPECIKCHEKKHPESMRAFNGQPVCSSCMLVANYERGKVDPAGMYSNPRDPEFG